MAGDWMHQKNSASLPGGFSMGGMTSPVVTVVHRGKGASGVMSPLESYWKTACLKQKPSVLLKRLNPVNVSRDHQ
jgi:hypothetical protein